MELKVFRSFENYNYFSSSEVSSVSKISKSSSSCASSFFFSEINDQVITKHVVRITKSKTPSKFKELLADYGIEKNNKIVINPLGAKNNSGETFNIRNVPLKTKRTNIRTK